MECMMIQRAHNIIFVVGFEITIEAKKKKIFLYMTVQKKNPYNIESYLIDIQYTVIVSFYDSIRISTSQKFDMNINFAVKCQK